MVETIHILIRILAVVVMLMTTGDCFSTMLAIRAGAIEANPVVAWWMKVLGPKWVIPRMLFGLVNVAAPIMRGDNWISVGILAVNAILLTWVVWHNLALRLSLLRQR